MPPAENAATKLAALRSRAYKAQNIIKPKIISSESKVPDITDSPLYLYHPKRKKIIDLSRLNGAPDDLLLSVPKTAKLTGLGVSTTWRHIAAGRIKAIRIGARATRVRLGDVRAL